MKETNRHLVTSIPGPKSSQLLAARNKAVPRGVSYLTPIFLDHAKGALIKDIDGNVFIDFSSGIAVLNVGHSQKDVVQAIKTQAEKFTHSCFMVLMYDSYVELADKLNNVVPGDSPKKTLFLNSGAEAVENAVKIARRYTKRPAIVSLQYGYHGRTLLTMTLTSKVKPYKFGFGPFAPEIYKMPSPYCYRCAFGMSHPECGLACAKYFEDFFKMECAAENIAAFIMEPVQGEGGFVVPPAGYIETIKEICSKHGILFIADEIQTGFGRTGKMFAIEHAGIEPDLMCLAKSLAAGMPLSAVVGKADIMDACDPGELGGTFGGNPIACKTGLTVLEVLEKENILAQAADIAVKARQRLERMQEKYSLIGDLRGLGPMMAIELVKDRDTKEPYEVKGILKDCYENGVIALGAGLYGNVVRLLMPLVITEEQLDTGLDVLENAIAKAWEGLKSRL